MKSSVSSILFTGIFAIISTGSLIAQTSNGNFEQWYRAKFGRPSPSEQARLTAQPVNAASAHPAFLTAESANSGFEQRYRLKVGRPSPTEEARLNSQQANPALPALTQSTLAAFADGGFEQRYQSKYGRPSPTEMARLDQTIPIDGLSKDQLSALIATAKTPAEHLRIAMFYKSQAQQYLALSKQHEMMLASYKSNSALSNSKNQASTTNHCAYLVQKFNALAASNIALAQSHENMATEAAKM